MSSERITSAELERSRKARAIAKNWLEAENTRLQLAGLDPALENNSNPGAHVRYGRRPSALDRIKEARISGLEIKEFSKGLGDETSTSKPTQINPATLVEQKSLIIRTLAANHTPEQIEQYMQRLGPYLDVAALAGADPVAQSLLYSRMMNGGGQQGLSIKDVAEVIGLVNSARSQQPQTTDPASIMNATANAMKAAAEISSSKNDSNPTGLVQTIYKDINETQRTLLQGEIQNLREELRQRSPETYLKQLRESADALGWGPREPEDPSITISRMDQADKQLEREYQSRQEDKRSKAQSEMIKGVMGTATKILEAPVLRELGKGIGAKIPGAGIVRTLNDAKVSAAKEQLENPLGDERVFDCPQCKRRTRFTAKDLISIQTNNNGRWVCPGCSEPYVLDNSDKKGGSAP